jgi:hypothetical protein
MKRLRSFILPGVGLGALAAGLFLGTTAPAIAATVHDVLVVNDATKPVPVTLQGSTAIAGTVSAQQSGAWTVGISGTPGVLVNNAIKIDPAGNTVTVGNLPTDPQGRLKTVRLGTLTQVSGAFTIVATSGAAIGPKVDTTSCHSVLALVSIDTSGALPPLNPLDLRLEMFEPGGNIVGRVTGTIVNDTVFQGTAAEFVVNGAPVVPPVSQLEYQNHNAVNINVKGVWLYCAS